ncbi:MAG: hypothetical protein AAF280_11890 [Pseudomonadota bacterium]
MREPDREPLGFSDLTEDESFLIILFRDWQRRGATRALAEHAIARDLRRDKFYPLLDAIFISFRSEGPGDRVTDADGVILTEAEETLLTRLSSMSARHPDGPAADAPLAIRPASQIVRSGRDRVLGDLNRLYWRTAAAMVLGHTSGR